MSALDTSTDWLSWSAAERVSWFKAQVALLKTHGIPEAVAWSIFEERISQWLQEGTTLHATIPDGGPALRQALSVVDHIISHLTPEDQQQEIIALRQLVGKLREENADLRHRVYVLEKGLAEIQEERLRNKVLLDVSDLATLYREYVVEKELKEPEIYGVYGVRFWRDLRKKLNKLYPMYPREKEAAEKWLEPLQKRLAIPLDELIRMTSDRNDMAHTRLQTAEEQREFLRRTRTVFEGLSPDFHEQRAIWLTVLTELDKIDPEIKIADNKISGFYRFYFGQGKGSSD